MKKRVISLFLILLLLSFCGCTLFEAPVDDPGGSLSSGTQSGSVSSDPAGTTDSADPSGTDADPEPHDIMKTPPSQLTKSEQAALAQYLFENYIPCSYGIFSQVQDLSSATVWSSVEALNQMIDKDTSAESRKLKAVQAKVERYFPGAEFDAESVRLYDKETESFYESPFTPAKYVFLAYEVQGDRITVYYEDDPNGEDRAQYATTLKQSTEEGYFSFVSSVRTGAVG